VPALIADEVQYTVLPPTNVMEPTRSGRARMLAMTGQVRSSALPDVPTMAEVGFPEVEQAGWVGVFAQGATPRDVVSRIASEITRSLKAPHVAARIRSTGYDAGGKTPEQFTALVKADVARYTRIVRDLKIPPAD
jgi:tripartite-type tricarboxylate transporter receptor subunit TctC